MEREIEIRAEELIKEGYGKNDAVKRAFNEVTTVCFGHPERRP